MSTATVKANRILAVVAACLFLLSALSYRESVVRAERFERGQKFLPNLNPDEIATISITKGGVETELNRRGDEFIVSSGYGYPADNASVNRFIKDVLELGLEKEVGSGDDLREELELTADGENTLEVAFANEAGNEMVRFLVGKAFDDGSGNYVLRTDGDGEDGEENEIYLTSSQVYLDTDSDDFVRKEIIDLAQSKVASIQGADFAYVRTDGSLALEGGVPSGMKESFKANQVKGVLSGLRFTKHYLADAPEVQGLRFDSELNVMLDDDSSFALAAAERDGKHFLRIVGNHQVTGQMQISLDASEDEVRETSEVLARADEIREFNELHGSWVYEVTETIADKVRMRRADLLEDA